MKENSIEEITFVENEIKNTRRLFEEVGCYAFFDEDLCKAIEHILSDYKRVLKENEELKQDRNNNYQMIALSQNEMLGYIQGYKDGKKLKRSAVANIVENQQYYIIYKQIKHYIEYIEKLQKENEELKIIKSAIQTLQINSIEDEKYIVISKGIFLDGSYKHLLDDYIPKSKVEELLKEIQEEGKIAYKNFMNKKIEEDFEIDGAILQELGYIEGKLQSLLGKD